ncbi:MAG: M23 family metallopeptidase [Minisyncoccia bacterium]
MITGFKIISKITKLLGFLLIIGIFSVIFYFVSTTIQERKIETEDLEASLLEQINLNEVNVSTTKEVIRNSLPIITLSSNSLQPGDTLIVKINDSTFTGTIIGKLGSTKTDFIKFTADGEWIGIFGIAAKTTPGKRNLIITYSNGQEIEKEIEIIPRKFPITKLVVTKELEKKGFTPAIIQDNVINKENILIGKVLNTYTPQAYFNKAFKNPLINIQNVGAFGNIRKNGNISLQHLGVDLEANMGTPVYAVNSGIISFEKELTNYGKTIIIDHGLGIFSLYLHLDEFKKLKGDTVQLGEVIGLTGSTGYSIEPHLHFSIKVHGSSVDPLKFIDITQQELPN